MHRRTIIFITLWITQIATVQLTRAKPMLYRSSTRSQQVALQHQQLVHTAL